MVTLQILVLSFLVRVRVPQQKELDCLLYAIQFFLFSACLLYEWLDNNSFIGACLSFILPAIYFGPV